MESIKVIRKKAGLSQQALVICLEVSGSLLSMAEKGLRDLPSAAVIKPGELEVLLLKPGSIRQPALLTPQEKTITKMHTQHEKKLGHHEYKIMRLERRLRPCLH